MPLDFNRPNLLTGGNNRFSTGIEVFSSLSREDVANLAAEAPAGCGGGSSINDVHAMESCINDVCAARNTNVKSRHDPAAFNRPEFFNTLLRHPILELRDPTTLKALRYYFARSMADSFCKDPPNDGNRAVVTDLFHVPAIDQPPLAVAFLGLAALAAVRLATFVQPELRPASPGLIQGIYLWMGLTPPAESIMPPCIDGLPKYNSYTDA